MERKLTNEVSREEICIYIIHVFDCFGKVNLLSLTRELYEMKKQTPKQIANSSQYQKVLRWHKFLRTIGVIW